MRHGRRIDLPSDSSTGFCSGMMFLIGNGRRRADMRNPPWGFRFPPRYLGGYETCTTSVHQPEAEETLGGGADVVGRAQCATIAGHRTSKGRPRWRGQIVFEFELINLSRDARPIQNQIRAGSLEVQRHRNRHAGGKTQVINREALGLASRIGHPPPQP